MVRGCVAGVSTSARLRLAVCFLAGVLGAMGTASAQTITLYSNSGGSNTLPSYIPFTILNLGTNSTANTKVQTSAVTTQSSPAKLPSGSEISKIAFGTGGSTPSAVFAGSVSGQAATPFGSNNTKTDFLVAGGGGSVTVSYTVTQDALQILWGSVDNSTTSNLITFLNSSGGTVGTVSGAQIAAAVGTGFVTGTTNVALRISGLPGYTSLVLSDANSAAFEFALGTPVPEPASIGLFGLAAAGVGFVSLRGRARRARSAA
jgi:hypothetical protein